MDIFKSADFLRTKLGDFVPQVAIILGTGLGRFTEHIEVLYKISYAEIPGFVPSTVKSHSGECIIGYVKGVPIIALSGRFHFYEGYSMQQVTFPVRVLGVLGIKKIMMSNAAGAVNPTFLAGDLVVIRDHINLFPENPLRGKNNPDWGVRFPDMMKAYDLDLVNKAKKIAIQHQITLHQGVYVGTQGPNLETPAEYTFFNRIGGDLVGMSTIPEVIVARHMDMKVFAVSVVSNVCFPIDRLTETTVDEVIQVVQSAEPKLSVIFEELIQEIGHVR